MPSSFVLAPLKPANQSLRSSCSHSSTFRSHWGGQWGPRSRCRGPGPLPAFCLGCLLTFLLIWSPRQPLKGNPVTGNVLIDDAEAGSSAPPAALPPLPWKPLLTAGQLSRGISFYGSGHRIERVAQRLLAGQPITAVTLGGSVTVGAGSTQTNLTSYPARFFQFLNASFPHRDHVLLNKGIGATTSGIFAVCAETLLPKDADIVSVELTFNEPADVPFTFPHRRGFEKMLRKLARLPHSPAIIVLHHYAWWHAAGDGVAKGLFYRPAEAQLGTMAQYYDFPSPSLRNALYPLMQADIPPFRVGRVHNVGEKSLVGEPIKAAGPKLVPNYFYVDGIHPSDTGHQVLAELLAGVVQTAVVNVLQAQQGAPGALLREPYEEVQPIQLPPPMIPGTVDTPTSLCAMQEDFKPLARAMSGFEYQAEKPQGRTFVEQKWGYRGEAVGAWLELRASTEEEKGKRGRATVHLGHLRSYRGMGLARVECLSGCTCFPTLVDGLWKQRTSLMQMHAFEVTQHPRCTLRVTIIERPGSNSSGSGGNKFQVSALMVAHEPVVLAQYASQAADLAASASTSA